MTIATDRVPQRSPLVASESAIRQPLKQLRVLLLKPYQPVVAAIQGPPLGLLYLVSSLRQAFASVDCELIVDVIDLKLKQWQPEQLRATLLTMQPDVVGFSALNFEAQASIDCARFIKTLLPNVITVMGGPYALNNAPQVLEAVELDWVFEGPAERTFSQALLRLARGEPLADDIKGFSRRLANGEILFNRQQDFADDIDALPQPAWDLIDFDDYAAKPNHAANLKGKRYAPLFTSRGCPYLCNYCHDIFSKKFRYHSVERVISEIEHLYETYGVTEFHIEDDIFNLHKPRVKQLMGEVQRRWPGKMHFAFPNGLRADILDKEVVDAMCDAGTYAVCIAIETVTPRLQTLIEKNLDIDKARRGLQLFYERGVQSTCFFMLGFPTETKEELEATINFAMTTPMTLAYFFTVIPQPNTPLFDLALQEHREITLDAAKVDSGSYRDYTSWYERVYGYPLGRVIRMANIRFYFSPLRALRIVRHWKLKSLLVTAKVFVQMLLTRTKKHSAESAS